VLFGSGVIGWPHAVHAIKVSTHRYSLEMTGGHGQIARISPASTQVLSHERGGVHLERLGQLGQCLVTAQGGQGDLGLELRGMVASGSSHGLLQAPQRKDTDGPIPYRPVQKTQTGSLYSLVETAKAAGLEPRAYLHYLFATLPKMTTGEDIDVLLPHRLTPELLKIPAPVL
jgi:hypothetical protein